MTMVTSRQASGTSEERRSEVEKTILVTGARGFIGFNAIQRWVKQNPSLNVIAIDANTYAD